LFDIYLPIRTVSESNCFEHWRTKAKRHKEQKLAVANAFKTLKPVIVLPCCITFTRVSPRALDCDNLVMAFKWIRDATCEYLRPGLAIGRADDSPQIGFKYRQEKGAIKEQAVRISIL
jgi:hypothetical protein